MEISLPNSKSLRRLLVHPGTLALIVLSSVVGNTIVTAQDVNTEPDEGFVNPVGTEITSGDTAAGGIDFSRHIIAVNQIGFEATRSKRFTAPITDDGTRFTIHEKGSDTVLFEDEISGKIGDFSAFVPPDSDAEYVIRIRGGDLLPGESDPFWIRHDFLKKKHWQSALDFLIDSRSVLGTHASAFGGCPWRDGTYYDSILPALVMFYQADPAWHRRSERQIDYAAEKKRVLAPDFVFNPEVSGGGIMESTRAYFELPAPAPDAPDIVKLIHWGTGFYMVNPDTLDPSRDPIGRKIHAQTLEQMAYVLWLKPQLTEWIPEAFFDRCHDLLLTHWESSGALGIPEWWSMDSYLEHPSAAPPRLHPFKGRHAPGHSIIPNLLMHEIALREGRDDAARYLDAAVSQTQWIVDHIDWQDPRTTKGHRMSEHKTIRNLVWMLQNYPEAAPKGLLAKIEDWARIAVSRSDNLWDFRRYDMDEHWTIPELNDVGNWIGAPSILTAASWVVQDDALKERLRELAITHIDFIFGRNPRLAAAPATPDLGFTGIERGWPKSYRHDVCARLETVRGSISSGPGSEMFPFEPLVDKYRHPEGWVNYGAAWCISLSYLAFDSAGQKTPQSSAVGTATIKPVSNVTSRSVNFTDGYYHTLGVDGIRSDESRWQSHPEDRERLWYSLYLDEFVEVQGIHLYTSHSAGDPIESLDIQFRDKNGDWSIIPSASLRGNTEKDLDIRFDTTVDVTTNGLRIFFPEPNSYPVSIRDVVIWPAAGGMMPPITEAAGDADASIPKIYLNQSGFNLGAPKRFTAPTLADGTVFEVHTVGGDQALFTGTIQGNLGDFSDFNPSDGAEYEVRAGGHTSVPFTIGLWQLERITYQLAIDFMVDSRHYVGNWTKTARNSYAWRDDHAFAWPLRTLVPQYLSNPAAYQRMPAQVQYEAPDASRENLWGSLEPYDEDAPDIVKLIHWGADVIVSQQLTHAFLKGDLAYFLYAWPVLEEWLPQQNYDVVLKFVQDNWANPEADQAYPHDTAPEHDLFALKTFIGSTKGEYPPGHSVMPNLLMYTVAERDGLPHAEAYFDAAYRQVEWLIEELDWEDPLTTKGQRVSEHITMTGLAAFQQMYPERAPANLQQKIEAWSDIVIRRSENMWDFRKLTDDGQWTPSGEVRTMWNEVGNVVGLPAVLLAAQPFVENEKAQARLLEIAWSHFDNAFGRNPTGRHFSYDAAREIEGVEHGWYSFYRGGIGQLENARFVLDGAPKHVHYPYHPEFGNYGWTEGWVQFNSAYNLSLAYLARANSALELKQEGDDLVVHLRAPVNFDPSIAEPITLEVHGGKSAMVTLTEVAPASPDYTGRIPLETLEVGRGDSINASYGFGYMAVTDSLTVVD